MKLAVLVLAAAPLALFGQDTRNVTEPVIPKSCAVLPARLAKSGKTLADADEAKPDTARIQQTLDQCVAGRGIEVRRIVECVSRRPLAAPRRRHLAGGRRRNAVRIA